MAIPPAPFPGRTEDKPLSPRMVLGRLWEIAENLHRADLSVQERADHIAEWIKITDEKVAQNGPPLGGSQPAEKGIRKAARELGISRQDAQRAEKIASIEPEARAVADEAGLNTQKDRLAIAAADPSLQAYEARRIAAERGIAHVQRQRAEERAKPAPDIKNEIESEEDWRRSLSPRRPHLICIVQTQRHE